MGMQNFAAYVESMHTAQQNQGGDYCQKRLSSRVQVMASGHQRTPGRGGAGELLVTDMILEPPLLSPKPGMVCFLFRGSGECGVGCNLYLPVSRLILTDSRIHFLGA